MHNSPLKNALLSIGLTDKESDVYLNILELGKGTVSQIARKANINRTTGYDILTNLVNKNLVTLSGKEPKQEYIAENPEKIISMLEEKIRVDNRKLKTAQQVIPQLKSIHNTKKRSQVKFYEGEDGLEQIYEDTLTSTETILAFAAVDDMHNALPKYFPKYYKRRSDKKIHVKAIIPDTKVGKERKKHDKFEDRTSALVPQKDFSFSPEINIYDNKMMIASWREKLGIIIESEEIADAMKKIHKLAWEEAKRLDKKIK